MQLTNQQKADAVACQASAFIDLGFNGVLWLCHMHQQEILVLAQELVPRAVMQVLHLPSHTHIASESMMQVQAEHGEEITEVALREMVYTEACVKEALRIRCEQTASKGNCTMCSGR